MIGRLRSTLARFRRWLSEPIAYADPRISWLDEMDGIKLPPCPRGVCDGSGLLLLVDIDRCTTDACPCVDDLVVNLPRGLEERMERAIADEIARTKQEGPS